MSGVQGMGTPSQVQPVIPSQPAPQVAQAPPASARPSLDEIFGQQASAQPVAQQRPSLDEIFGQAQAAPQVDERSFGQKIVDDAKDIISKPLEIASDIGKVIASPVEGAASAVATQFNEHPLKTIIDPLSTAMTAVKGAGKGIIHPLSQPELGASLNKAFPITKNMSIDIPAPNPDGPVGDPSDPVFRQKVTPAQALDLAASFMIPEVAGGMAVKALSKAPEIAKLVGRGIAPVLDGLKSLKPASKLEAAVNPSLELSQSVAGIQKAADALAQVGEKIPLTPSMANPADKAAQDVAEAVKNNKVYLQIQDELGNRLARNITEHVPQGFANLSKDAATTDEIFSTIQGQKGSSGKVIGDLKLQASKELGSTPLKAQKFQESVDGLLEQLTSPDEANKLYISNDKKAEEVQNYLNQLSEKLYNNPDGLSFGEWEQIYKGLTAKSKQPYSDASQVWNKLRSAMSQSQDPMMAQGLAVVNPEAAAKFVKGKKDYSTIMDAYDKMSTLLSKDEVSANALVKNLFDSEAASVDRAQAAMQVLGIENPKMVQDLRGHAYNYFIDKARVPISPDNPAGIDFQKFSNMIKKLQGSSPASRNLLDILSGSPRQSEMLMNLAKTSEAFASGYKAKSTVMNETLFGRMAYYAKEASKDPKAVLSKIVDAYQRDEKLAKVFNNMDVENIIQGFPPNQRKEATVLINKVLKK